MSQAPVVVLSVLLAAAAATGVSFALRPAADAGPNPTEAELLREIADLKKQAGELQKKCDALANAPAPATAAPAVERTAATLPPEAVAAAVEAYLSKRPGAAAEHPAAGAGADPSFDVDRAFADLAGTNFWENSAAWKKAFAAGRMDDMIAKFEAAAKANPTDPKVQMQLANAYLAYLQMDQSKWQLSMKADKVFDNVLEQDPNHWEARFTKAVSYTFWPDFLGKKPDAIRNFQTLVDQQETMPVEPHQASTYLYLGNLLERSDPAKAKEIWARGLRRHPDNQELAKKVRG